MSTRLRERGVEIDADRGDLVLPPSCASPTGPSLRSRPASSPGHGWRTRAAGRHSRRSGPTRGASLSIRCRRSRTTAGPEQLDGAWAAVAGETDEAIATGTWLAETLGLRPFVLDDSRRALYHAGAAIASNYPAAVTLRRAAGELFDASGVPGEALEPLMRRVIENVFQLTGPIQRGDWGTVERHRTAIAETAPDLAAGLRRARRRSPRATPSREGAPA